MRTESIGNYLNFLSPITIEDFAFIATILRLASKARNSTVNKIYDFTINVYDRKDGWTANRLTKNISGEYVLNRRNQPTPPPGGEPSCAAVICPVHISQYPNSKPVAQGLAGRGLVHRGTGGISGTLRCCLPRKVAGSKGRGEARRDRYPVLLESEGTQCLSLSRDQVFKLSITSLPTRQEPPVNP